MHRIEGGPVNSGWQSIRQRFAAVHSDHKRIAVGAVWVAGFVLVGKLAAGARDMAIAWRYGVSETVDAYQLAFTFVFWLPVTLVSVLTIVLVPMLVRQRQSSAEDRTRFLQELSGTVVLVGIVLVVASLLFGRALLPHFADKLSNESRVMAWNFTIGMAPLALLSLVLGVYAARLMAQERQINTLLEAVPAIAILLFVLLWPSESKLLPLLWGTAFGMVAQTIWSWRVAGKADGETSTSIPRFARQSPYWPEFYKAIGVMAAGQLVMSLITPLDQYTAGQLGGGAISILGYSSRLIGFLLGVGAMAFSRAALPLMSNFHATGQTARAEDISFKWAALMLTAGALVAVVAWALAPLGVSLLFERGAFTPNDTQLVVEAFRWGLIQVPFYYFALVMVQLLASCGQYKTIAFFAASNFGIKFVLNLVLSPWMGIAGIALATGLMYAWSAGCLWWAVTRTRAS